ncbi:MAG: GAF and ANTAR domain-containing protein [Solirubrobacterales bacterium]|nr:GAF and ANTAR domain-containing protein [Solirubrobacterales bacterium]
MSREQRIVETFVELADMMVDEFDVVDFLHRLAGRCVELLDCAEAGILLADAAGVLRVMASSSERSEALELLQSQNEEGPCFECVAGGRTVFSENLDDDRARWPVFAPAAVRRGVRSVHALPMRARGATIGGLNLFRSKAGRIDQPDATLAQGMADIAAIALIQERTLREGRDVVSQLQGALTSRVVIEQATGMLAERAQIGMDVAFARLRHHAREKNRRLSEVARELIDSQLDASELAAATSEH